MSIELMAKCARCGDVVPFSSRDGAVPTVPGVIFCRIGQKGLKHHHDADVFALCHECRDEVRALVDIEYEKYGTRTNQAAEEDADA